MLHNIARHNGVWTVLIDIGEINRDGVRRHDRVGVGRLDWENFLSSLVDQPPNNTSPTAN